MTTKQAPKRAAGRKPLAEDDDTVMFSLRMTTTQREKLDRLGGGPWVRKKIDQSKEPPPTK